MDDGIARMAFPSLQRLLISPAEALFSPEGWPLFPEEFGRVGHSLCRVEAGWSGLLLLPLRGGRDLFPLRRNPSTVGLTPFSFCR